MALEVNFLNTMIYGTFSLTKILMSKGIGRMLQCSVKKWCYKLWSDRKNWSSGENFRSYILRTLQNSRLEQKRSFSCTNTRKHQHEDNNCSSNDLTEKQQPGWRDYKTRQNKISLLLNGKTHLNLNVVAH